MTGHRTSWETNMRIWHLAAKQWSDNKILDYLSKHQDEYPDYPQDRNTVGKIRNDFSLLAPAQLKQALKEDPELETLVDDKRILADMERLFDRPAFTTPWQFESDIPGFKQAITDTIEALNVGNWKTTKGEIIEKIRTRHQLHGSKAKETLQDIVHDLQRLRGIYDDAERTKKITCHGIIDQQVAFSMDEVRQKILEDFRRIHPASKVKLLHKDFFSEHRKLWNTGNVFELPLPIRKSNKNNKLE